MAQAEKMLYRVSGASINAIKLAYKSTKRKEKGVFWFDDLNQAKQQVLVNQQVIIDGLIAEKEKILKQLEWIEEHLLIMQKPVNLDVITDDYLLEVNATLEKLSEEMAKTL